MQCYVAKSFDVKTFISSVFYNSNSALVHKVFTNYLKLQVTLEQHCHYIHEVNVKILNCCQRKTAKS